MRDPKPGHQIELTNAETDHFLNTASLEQAISAFIAYYNQAAKPIKWSYTVEKLERKLGTNS
jgi:hypothetical protein